MAYVAARGGEAAIQAAEQFFRDLNGSIDARFVQSIQQHMPYLIDRVMGEGSLYAPDLAALAIAQAGGDLYEAVLLLRAYRSTQPRLGYTQPILAEETLTVRRICAAFKDIPGGQILGPTLDYSHRLLQMDVLDGAVDGSGGHTTTDARCCVASTSTTNPSTTNPSTTNPSTTNPSTTNPSTIPSTLISAPPTVASWQRAAGLLAALPEQPPIDPTALPDVTRDPISTPTPRAHRLQSLARADTGGILSLGYASMRGYGLAHPTVNEVRLGYADLQLHHPVTGIVFSAGRVRVSSCEVVSNAAADQLELGYTATLGWNEVKVIAGSMLDLEMSKPQPHPAHSEDFVLYHTEAVESSGFCIHYKLPHYVTFASGLDIVRKTKLDDKVTE